jgi:hypothetical protein
MDYYEESHNKVCIAKDGNQILYNGNGTSLIGCLVRVDKVNSHLKVFASIEYVEYC